MLTVHQLHSDRRFFEFFATVGVKCKPSLSGLCLESETVLCPVEVDADSHRPLMSDEEEEEVYVRQQQSIQHPDEHLGESAKAISFCQAFLLPGVLPVGRESSLKHCIKNQAELMENSHCVACVSCSIPWLTPV